MNVIKKNLQNFKNNIESEYGDNARFAPRNNTT